MIEVKSHYRMNELTFALLPAKQIEYETIVIETDRMILIKKTPIELIETACQNEWSTYEGRRKAVIHHTKFKRKVPIPINIEKEMYFFPTLAPTNIHNIWIAYRHIQDIKQHQSNPAKSTITFVNGVKLSVDISYHMLDQQMKRTFECKYKMKRLLIADQQDTHPNLETIQRKINRILGKFK